MITSLTRTLPALACAALAAAACATETVELWPDSAAADGAPAHDQRGDRAADRSADLPPDAASPDATLPDQTQPDTTPSCVCRYNRCRTAIECEQNIGPGSTCTPTLCSGAAGPCTEAADCGGDPSAWLCTQGATSTRLCP